ncbi:MAG: D-alanyl-D-alanine carboxypeptidase/D-alanyl-D-alanine-endopeptidase [Bacteroidales bacterium]|jgi:D-alanyl-D-alanine carboxypeptidase/D-alanyl-D-alanine-endopeptidase (penicillin-binding protein 4)
MKKILQILLLLSFFFGCASSSPKTDKNPENSPDISRLVTDFISAKGLEHASAGLLAIDLTIGDTLLDFNSNQSLVAASTQKLVTSAAALEIFGPDYTFNTSLEYEGTIDKEGILKGNIIIHGGGDPALDSPLFSEFYSTLFDSWVKAIQTAGFRKIEGKVIGDASIFGKPEIPDTWVWEDIGNYYGSLASGLNIYDNTFTIDLKTSDKSGSPAQLLKVTPFLPWMSFENQVTASDENRDKAYIFFIDRPNQRIIKGTLPKNKEQFTIKGSIPDPAYLAAFELTNALENAGIEVLEKPASVFEKQEPSDRQTLFEISSPVIREIIYYLNLKSINLYAETLLKQVALYISSDPSTESGCKVLEAFWKSRGMDTGGMFLQDGSGLSRYNALTAGQLVFVLQYMKSNNKNFDVFENSLPVSGKSGSLENLGNDTPAEGNLRAKSGYMARCMSYAGYVTTVSGRDVAFAVIVNNYSCSNTEMRKILEDLMVGMSGM